MTGNVDFGVLAVGPYQPNELAGQTSTSLESSGNTFDANVWGTATSATNGTDPSAVNGAEVMDGTGWGGGCASETGDCTTAGVGPLLFEGPNTTFDSSAPGSGTFTLSVCNSGTASEVLPAGAEITFSVDQPDDGGTFFVTSDTIVTSDVPSVGGCSNPLGFQNLSLQAIAPADVGTLDSPTGQPYVLSAGDTVTVNQNGPTIVHSANIYGRGSTANSCTPADVDQVTPPVVTPDVFGATDPPTSPFAYSTTLQASTGGVNATYSAC
jgi:hypothetical protein